MAHEDHSKRHSSGGSSAGGSGGDGDNRKLSRKLKPIKFPQRGLGVAKLEKMRLEEEQRTDDASSSILPPKNLIINSSNCFPLPPPWSLNNDVLNQIPHAPLPTILESSDGSGGGGGEIGRLMRGRGGWLPKMLNNESSNEVEGLDDRGEFAFMKNVLPYESNFPTWPVSNVVQQRTQYFGQPCSSSLANVSTGNSYSAVSESSMNLQMEPRSNQSKGKNVLTPSLWSEEDKMARMKKRSYPFSLDNGGTFSIEPTYQVMKEGQSRDPCLKKVGRDSSGCRLNGDFLTLAPPETQPSAGPTLINFFPPQEKTQSSQVNGERTEEIIDLNLKL